MLLSAVTTVDVVGQQEYTTPGTYTWIAPNGVTSVCVVAVGAGGSGMGSGGPGGFSGNAGGGLGWKNNITVTPGQSYTIQVGEPNNTNSAPWQSGQGSTYYEGPGDSYFINATTVKGGSGWLNNSGTGSYQTYGGNYVGDGGGNGGQGGGPWTYDPYGAGAGGGGGAGGAGKGSAGGGGVGIYGQGADGTGGTKFTYNSSNTTPMGGGGSGGSDGGGTGASDPTGGDGGNYGGGAGSYGDGGPVGTSAGGAVRIIWGAGRAFPSTNTADV